MNQKKWSVALIAAVLFALVVPAVQAEAKKPDAFCKSVALAVITCVRPSSQLHKDNVYLPRITSHEYKSRKPGRFDLTVNMAWNGLWTKNPYQSTFTVKTEFDGKRIEILGIDYTDDCLVPAPDVRLLNGLIRELNEKLDSSR